MSNLKQYIFTIVILVFITTFGGVLSVLVQKDTALKETIEDKTNTCVVVNPNIRKLHCDSIDPIPEIDADEIHCMALNIWHESRGESREDQLAVAHVTKNRVKSRFYPNNVCAVVHQGQYAIDKKTGRAYPIRNRCQFSWWCDGKSDRIRLTNEKGTPIKANIKLWKDIQKLSFDVLAGYTDDPTDGATHYLNPNIVKNMPRWTQLYTAVHQTDNHRFYRM